MPFLNHWRGCPVECGLVYYLEGMHLCVPVPLKKVRRRSCLLPGQIKKKVNVVFSYDVGMSHHTSSAGEKENVSMLLALLLLLLLLL